MGTERGNDLRDSFVERLHAHQRIVSKVASLYAEEREEREDLVQEIVLQLWRAYGSFRGDSTFATWAYRVALNTALLRRRSAGRRAGVVSASTDVDVFPAPSAPDPVEAGEGARLLHACIRTLAPLDRALILLHLEGRPHAESAAILGLSEGNVGVRLHRIKNTLRACLTARGYTEELAS